MNTLNTNKLLLAVFKDGENVLDGIEVEFGAIELSEGADLDEYQYYIHKVGFYLVHTVTWCRQLELAIEFLSNFDYSKKIDATRADHLIYNLENYFIRLNSVYDRVLQIVNAVFHLCISEEDVGHSVVVNNYKVQHRQQIKTAVKKVQKYLKDYSQTRHTLIHKHSYLDVKLKKIELFYMQNIEEFSGSEVNKKRLKSFRSNYLRNFIAEKKEEFKNINNGLFLKLGELFDLLWEEYERLKKSLIK